jgi:hypothetical protein
MNRGASGFSFVNYGLGSLLVRPVFLLSLLNYAGEKKEKTTAQFFSRQKTPVANVAVG